MAGPTGFEPATSSVTGKRSNQLSYGPTWGKNEQQDWASQVHRGADSNRKRRIQQGFEHSLTAPPKSVPPVPRRTIPHGRDSWWFSGPRSTFFRSYRDWDREAT